MEVHLKNRTVVKGFGLVGSLAMLSLWAGLLGLPACVAADPGAEPVGEAQQEVGLGGACSVVLSEFCDTGLTCCIKSGFLSGNCRDLVNDPDNCGSCGNVCQSGFGCNPGTSPPSCRTSCNVNTDCRPGFVCNANLHTCHLL